MIGGKGSGAWRPWETQRAQRMLGRENRDREEQWAVCAEDQEL